MFIRFKLFIVRYRMANFVYHHWVYTSTYWPLSYPFRSLGILCMCVFVESIYGLFRTTRMVLNSPRKIAPRKKMTSQKILEKIIFLFLVFLHSSLSQKMAESQKWELKYRLVNTDTLSDEC